MATEKTNTQLTFKPPIIISDVSDNTSWDEWLSETESKLEKIGYRRYVQNHKGEDFSYWKTFKKGEDKIYQVGVLFYDFRWYTSRNPQIQVMYQCMLLGEDRIDMCVSRDIDLVGFEDMAQTFYKAMWRYYRKSSESKYWCL